jgi:hypothetical protein
VGIFEGLTNATSHVDGEPDRQRIACVTQRRDELPKRYPVDEFHGTAAFASVDDYVEYSRNALMVELHRAVRPLGEHLQD